MDRMEDIKPFGFMRYWDYVRANFFIMWKRLVEYKVNFFFLSMEHLIYIGSFIVIFDILFSNFFEVLSWQLEDYVLFFVLMDWIFTLRGIFFWRYPCLNMSIIQGYFNLLFLRPVPRFIAYFFSNLSKTFLVYSIINPIMYIFILVVFFDINVSNVGLTIVLWFMIFICFILYQEFIYSLEFLKKGLSLVVFSVTENINYGYCHTYPYQFFKGVRYKELFFLFSPLFFVGSLIIPILKNYEIWNLKLQIFILLGLILFFSVGIAINWHYGLKRYEAYG